MKKWILCAVALTLTCLLCGQALAEEELTMLRAEGKQYVNEKGEAVLLRGVNVGGWLTQESWMCLTNAPSQMEAYATLDARFGHEERERLFGIYEDNYLSDSDFDNVKALGMNVMRLPFAWWNIMDADGHIHADAFKRMDWFVEKCGERGLYVILDLHAAQGSQNGNDHSGSIEGAQLWENETYLDRTVKLWETIAAHYKGNPIIAAYDLINEPGGKWNATTKLQWDFFDRLYDAIRAIDSEHIIMIESCWEPEDLPSPAAYDWENVSYQYHFYRWNADNDYYAQKLFTNVKLHKLNQTDHGVPSIVGEFTLFQNMDAWAYALDAYQNAGISYVIWTYKVTGRSSWGLYNVIGDKVDIYNDSAADIERKWRDQGLLRRNDELCRVVASAIAGAPVELPKEEITATQTPVKELDLTQATALDGAKVTIGDGQINLTTLRSADPGTDKNAFSLTLPTPQDFSAYRYLTFFINDRQGSNTHRVTLVDKNGGEYSTWVDIPSVHMQWARIDMPLSMVGGIDLSAIAEVRIGEWNSGDYLFSRMFLCDGMMDE